MSSTNGLFGVAGCEVRAGHATARQLLFKTRPFSLGRRFRSAAEFVGTVAVTTHSSFVRGVLVDGPESSTIISGDPKLVERAVETTCRGS